MVPITVCNLINHPSVSWSSNAIGRGQTKSQTEIPSLLCQLLRKWSGSIQGSWLYTWLIYPSVKFLKQIWIGPACIYIGTCDKTSLLISTVSKSILDWYNSSWMDHIWHVKRLGHDWNKQFNIVLYSRTLVKDHLGLETTFSAAHSAFLT